MCAADVYRQAIELVRLFREKIRARLATALGIDSSSVSVKGKTNEGMGWIGRKEGLACIAVATLKGNR